MVPRTTYFTNQGQELKQPPSATKKPWKGFWRFVVTSVPYQTWEKTGGKGGGGEGDSLTLKIMDGNYGWWEDEMSKNPTKRKKNGKDE